MRVVAFTALVVLHAASASAQVLDVRNLNAEQIRLLDRAHTAVLIPGGILEEHGPYLPANSDGYQNDFIMRKVAEAIVARPGWTVLEFPPLTLGTTPANELGGRFVFPGSYAVRTSTLRAVYLDLASDLGEAGFKTVFLISAHGAPTHARALDDACRFFNDTYSGRMIHLTGLAAVMGAVPRDIFTPEQRVAEGFSVHADADEHSRLLFLRPDLVAPGVVTARPVVGRTLPDLAALAKQEDWPGYFGTPAIANAAAGSRGMNAIADAAVRIALQVLDGGSDAGLPRVGDRMSDPMFKPFLDPSLAHEREIERRQNDWLAKQE